MSGDNLHGKQPLKFYSEDLTITKILLIENYFNFKYKNENNTDPEMKYNELKDLLA
tara:strand:- start:5283 stop:5450 length:168 start_codon:yes stop_codon:yes gene_type:complete